MKNAEVLYNTNSHAWQEVCGADRTGKAELRSWLTTICNMMGQHGWEFVDVLWEQNQMQYRLLFRQPGSP